MYKLLPKIFGQQYNALRLSDNASIPFDPANTDYATFKADILADKATLQDAAGNEMTAQQAKDFVLTLP